MTAPTPEQAQAALHRVLDDLRRNAAGSRSLAEAYAGAEVDFVDERAVESSAVNALCARYWGVLATHGAALLAAVGELDADVDARRPLACTCRPDGERRQVLLEIGDFGRVLCVLCPNCELPVLTPEQIGSGLHAQDLLATMTCIVEPAEGEEPEYVWYSLTSPPAELLESGGAQ